MNLSFTLMQENSDLRKLFYIYPFNTLVEQNMSILEKTFGNKKEIMSQIAVVNSLVPFKDKKEVEEDRENSKKYQEILLDRQFLNYPFILSTHVMFVSDNVWECERRCLWFSTVMSFGYCSG